MRPVPTIRRVAARAATLRQLHHLDDVVLFARAVAVAAVVPLFVRLSLPRQAAVLSRPPRRSGRRPIRDVDQLVRCVELAQRAARPLVRPGCLTRAITLYWFLGRHDDQIELCFGLGHPVGAESYDGHCWLSRGGQPFLERVDPRDAFGVVYRIPATGT